MSKEVVTSKAAQLKSGLDLFNRLAGYAGEAGFDGAGGTHPRHRNLTRGEVTIGYRDLDSGLSFPKTGQSEHGIIGFYKGNDTLYLSYEGQILDKDGNRVLDVDPESYPQALAAITRVLDQIDSEKAQAVDARTKGVRSNLSGFLES